MRKLTDCDTLQLRRFLLGDMSLLSLQCPVFMVWAVRRSIKKSISKLRKEKLSHGAILYGRLSEFILNALTLTFPPGNFAPSEIRLKLCRSMKKLCIVWRLKMNLLNQFP